MRRIPWPVMLMCRELSLGGSERQLTETAKGLDRTRFTPHVACFDNTGPFGGELRAAGVPVLPLPVHSFRSRSALHGGRLLARYLRAHEIALLHTFDMPGTAFGVPVARVCGTPFVISSQRAYRDLVPGSLRRLVRMCDRMVDRTVVNCEAMRNHLIDDEGVAATHIRLCYNSIDTELFYPAPRLRPAGLEQAGVVIGTACILRPEKALPILVDAFAAARGVRSGLKLLIVGSGPELPKLQAHAQARGISEDCVFLPASRDMPTALRAFDIFVLPSTSEALSNSLLEALASGCCAVASQVGGNPELIRHGETGMLFRSGDTAGLIDLLLRLSDDAALRARLGAGAATSIRARFPRGQSVVRMEQIYLEILDGAECATTAA